MQVLWLFVVLTYMLVCVPMKYSSNDYHYHPLKFGGTLVTHCLVTHLITHCSRRHVCSSDELCGFIQVGTHLFY